MRSMRCIAGVFEILHLAFLANWRCRRVFLFDCTPNLIDERLFFVAVFIEECFFLLVVVFQSVVSGFLMWDLRFDVFSVFSDYFVSMADIMCGFNDGIHEVSH